MSASISGKNSTIKEDRIRERELYRYYNPVTSIDAYAPTASDRHNLLAHKTSSPDTTLTALGQLCTLKLNLSLCMISLVTKDTQYVISEATKSLDLTDSSKFDEDDGLWAGCGSLDRIEGLCGTTLRLPQPKDGFSIFTVPDLPLDEHFKNKPFVAGPPYWRFYVGTPLKTKRGVNIGTLCMLDKRPRDGLSSDQEGFLGTIAQTMMQHLEMSREANERRKNMLMSSCLNAFVEGKDRRNPATKLDGLNQNIANVPQERSNSHSHHFSSPSDAILGKKESLSTSRSGSVSTSISGNAADTQCYSSPRRSNGSTDASTERDSTMDVSEVEAPFSDTTGGHAGTFVRASNLLHEALDLEQHGGVVFFDSTVGFRQGDDKLAAAPSDFGGISPPDAALDITSSQKDASESYDEVSTVTAGTLGRQLLKLEHPAKAGVLGMSEEARKSGFAEKFTAMTEQNLQFLLEHYPRGKVWCFDEDGGLSSSEDDDTALTDKKATLGAPQSRARQRMVTASLLQRHFPRARSLLFAPLWDAGLSRWFSGCFSWSSDEHQVFSRETELSFLMAFGNSVMAEVSRLTTIAADQQKGDFIGSISHELRSPLHGILASAEFLSDTTLNAFQNSLADTIDSCGRTLLDTINHVLDFSKINSFERNWKKLRPRGMDGRTDSFPTVSKYSKTSSPSIGAPPLLNIYAVTNIAAITEEVVEGVYAGQTYQDISTMDITDITPGARGRTSERGLTSRTGTSLNGREDKVVGKPIEVILDIDLADFTFTTQPGALRRVIMNIFGNALKYTEKGTITIKLRLSELPSATGGEKANSHLLTITITDTGKGISSQYLKTRLFTPFAQENTLAPGTGLGLSIVRAITNMLGGSIDVRSQIDVGTEVIVRIPLLKVAEGGTPSSTPSTTGSLERQKADSVSVLQSEATDKHILLYGFQTSTGQDSQISLTGRMLQKYISEWYRMRVSLTWTPLEIPNVVIVDELDLPSVMDRKLPIPSIIVLSNNASRNCQPSPLDGSDTLIERMSKPFGPFKLAKALRICLEKTRITQNSLTTVDELANGTSNEAQFDLPTSGFEQMTLRSNNASPLVVQTNGTITASDTVNAQLSMGTTTSESNLGPSSNNPLHDFPFPNQKLSNGNAGLQLPSGPNEQHPTAIESVNGPCTPPLGQSMEPPSSVVISNDAGPEAPKTRIPDSQIQKAHATEHNKAKVELTQPVTAASSAVQGASAPQLPRILLVDDNKINLRLLETFMSKRNYDHVDSATDGRQAVETARQQTNGYDIIFMDISMPVMNGFEATRAIRDIESSRLTSEATSPLGHTPPALIIALTGLASSRDQGEAFASGVDLFMTKPVSFKEVGRMLDNWEAHGGSIDRALGGVSSAGMHVVGQ